MKMLRAMKHQILNTNGPNECMSPRFVAGVILLWVIIAIHILKSVRRQIFNNKVENPTALLLNLCT